MQIRQRQSLSTQVGRSLLNNNEFDIEFNGFLSNHAKHAIVALDRIDAPPNRIQDYWDQYTTLTPYKLPLHKVTWNGVKAVTSDEWNTLRGRKENWQGQVQKIHQEIQAHDYQHVLQKYAPELLPGIAGGLTHGLIHLGWGIDADSPWMVAEGIAYLNFCSLGVDESHFKVNRYQDETPYDSYLRIAKAFENDGLAETWVDRAKAKYDETFHPELVSAGFQWQLSKVLEETPHQVTDLPSWLSGMPIDVMFRELYYAATLLYLATRSEGKGSFLVLHLLSSLWALENVIGVLKDESVQRMALMQFFASSVGLMATAGYPSVEVLERVRDEFPLSDTDSSFGWSETVQAGMAEEEEHNIKLVYVTRELWKRYDHWRGFAEAAMAFTETPKVGPLKDE